ncbi:MAG: hypothetical protein ABTD50_15625 [Polyangiaceae bacterium]
MDLPPDFRELLAEFARCGVEAVLVGGYAVAFHGRPRATKDIDLVLEGSRANLQRASDKVGAHVGEVGAYVGEVGAYVGEVGVSPRWMRRLPVHTGLSLAEDGV